MENLTEDQKDMAIHSARYILEDLGFSGMEKLAELTGLPMGVIVSAFENIFPERVVSGEKSVD